MFAVLLLPAFSLQALTRLEEKPPTGPAVATAAEGRQSRVIAANEAATAARIELGMTVAQARARHAGVTVFSRRPSAEEATMDLLHALVYTHTPKIERTGPGVLTVDLAGLRLRPADLPAFGLTLLDQVHPHGLEARLGFAPLPDLARFTARAATKARPLLQIQQAPESLAALPFTATEASPALCERLAELGLRDLGAFLALPRAEVARHLGTEALHLWETASGASTRLLRLTLPARTFEAAQELDYAVHTLEPLLFLVRRFLDQIEAQLRAASQYASHLTLELPLDHAPPYSRRFALPEPSQQAELLFRVLHLHLEQVTTAEPIVGLRLIADPVDPPHRQRQLFHTSLKDPWRFADTQAQLVGLLGSDAVGRPRLADTHRPDAFYLEPLLEEVAPLTPRAEEDARERPGPALRRFRPPVAARVTLREGHPTYLESSLQSGPITRLHGPFHLSGDWWQRDTAWQHTAWDIELASGPAFRLLQGGSHWFLEGIYD